MFIRQIKLANELDLPILIHMRDATLDTLEILKEYPCKGIMHCYSGSLESAKILLNLGYYISFATNALFSKKHKKNIKAVPLENMLTETDSPYLSPIKGEPNQPSNIKMTIERIERTKHIDFEEIEKQTEKNAIQVYNL